MVRQEYKVEVRVTKTVTVHIGSAETLELGDAIHDAARCETPGLNIYKDDFEVLGYKAV